jgi:hypothetical protein
VIPGTYGSTAQVAAFTVNAQGIITAAAQATISPGAIGAVASVTAGTGITVTGTATNPIVNANLAFLDANLTFLPLAGGTLTGNLLPNVDNTLNLGSPAARWANAYAAIVDTNAVTAPSGNLALNAGAGGTVALGAGSAIVNVAAAGLSPANDNAVALGDLTHRWTSIATITQAPGTNNGLVATTAFVQAAIAAIPPPATGVTVGTTPPGSPTQGSLWWNDNGVNPGGGQLYMFYNDGNSTQWIPAAVGATGPQGQPGVQGPTGPPGPAGTSPWTRFVPDIVIGVGGVTSIDITGLPNTVNTIQIVGFLNNSASATLQMQFYVGGVLVTAATAYNSAAVYGNGTPGASGTGLQAAQFNLTMAAAASDPTNGGISLAPLTIVNVQAATGTARFTSGSYILSGGVSNSSFAVGSFQQLVPITGLRLFFSTGNIAQGSRLSVMVQ